MMGHLSADYPPHLLQPALLPDASLWGSLELYLAQRRVTLEEFRRRHRIDKIFLEMLQAGRVPDTHPAAAKVRKMVAFGPDLRCKREVLGVTLRTLAIKSGITPSRLSRAERLLAELAPLEKRKVDKVLAEIEKRHGRELQAAHRQRLATVLRTSRLDRRLTQEALAKALGCGRKAVLRWEKDGSVPEWRFPHLQRILPGFSPIAAQKGH